MSPVSSRKRPMRIGGASGGFSDRVFAITQLAKNPDVDVIMGDWLSEMTMTMHGQGKVNNQKKAAAAGKGENNLGVTGTGHHAAWNVHDSVKNAMFAENFIDCFRPAIPYLAKNGQKLAVNAGASDTEVLAKYVKQMCEEAGYPMKVAWVEGDDVTEAVEKLIKKGEKFESLMHGKALAELGLDPVCAQAYVGGLGIAEALRQGADIVICGRVADAAPAIGAAA